MRTSLHILAPHDIANMLQLLHQLIIFSSNEWHFPPFPGRFFTPTCPHGSGLLTAEKGGLTQPLRFNPSDRHWKTGKLWNQPRLSESPCCFGGVFSPGACCVLSDFFKQVCWNTFCWMRKNDLYKFDRRLRAMEKKTWIAAKCGYEYHNIEFPGSIQVGQHSRVSEVRPQPCTQEANGKASWMHSLGCRHLW